MNKKIYHDLELALTAIIVVVSLFVFGSQASATLASNFAGTQTAHVSSSLGQATLKVVDAPTFKIVYDSARKESAIKSEFKVKVTAIGDLCLGTNSGLGINAVNEDKDYTGGWRGPATTTTVFKDGFRPIAGCSVTDEHGNTYSLNGYSKLPAGKAATFLVSSTFNPNAMYEGTYHGEAYLSYLTPNNLSDYVKGDKISKSINIIGERAPYITSIHLSTLSIGQKVVVVSGQRMNLATSIVIGSSVFSSKVAISNTSVTFRLPSDFKEAYYFPVYLNSAEGKSNNVNLGTVQAEPSIKIVPLVNGKPFDNNVGMKVGDVLTIDTYLSNLTTNSYNISNNYDGVLNLDSANPVCTNESLGNNNWRITCIPKVAGNSHIYEVLNVSGVAYRSNDIYINVSTASTQPSITVSSPSSGQVLRGGNTYPIRWDSANIGSSNVNIDIYATLPAGAFPAGPTIEEYIHNNVPNTGVYYWKVPDTYAYGYISNQFSVRVYVGSNTTPSASGQSNYFTILPGSPTPAAVHFTSPKIGESYQIGGLLGVSLSGSVVGERITLLEKNNSQFARIVWLNQTGSVQLPSDISARDDYYLKLDTFDNSGYYLGTAYSNTFSINSNSNTPTVSLAVNGNHSNGYSSPYVNLGNVNTVNITWNSVGATYCNTYGMTLLKLTDGTVWDLNNLPSSGTRSFVTTTQRDAHGDPMTSASIGIQCWKDNVSESKGIVVSWTQPQPQVTPSVTVVYPNGGDTLIKGQQYTVSWTTELRDDSGYTYGAYLERNGNTVLSFFGNSFTSLHSLSWTPSTTLDGGGGYKIRVVMRDRNGQEKTLDRSDSTFSIDGRLRAPSISGLSITNLNGGSAIQVRGGIKINWQLQNAPVGSKVGLKVYRNGAPFYDYGSTSGTSFTEAAYTPCTTVDASLIGSGYEIRAQLYDANNNAISGVTASVPFTLLQRNCPTASISQEQQLANTLTAIDMVLGAIKTVLSE